MAEELYDIAICGAGPAGATAGILLAQQEREVALIDGRKFPVDDQVSVWLGAKSEPLLETLGIRNDPLFERAFAQVVFYSADFTKTIEPAFEGPAGFLLNRSELDSLLVKTAKKAGAKILDSFMIDQLSLEEKKAVIVAADGRNVESKLMLLATGRESPLVQRCGFRTGRSTQSLWTAQVDHLRAKEDGAGTRVIVVLGLNKRGSFGMICSHGKQLSLSVHWIGEPRDATPGLISLCKLALEHDIIDVDLAKRAAGAPVIGSPASAALEYDSHVGKHSLLIGDAGGFVAAASNEGIYPAMWSARIAADVVHAALASPYSQDELMAY
ncbi:MAG: NAD(P)/FAD-dependent oxidoreductase, partial [Phycisphaerae bacterium]